MSSHPVLLAADWGTTNFRLYLLNEVGHIIEQTQAGIGLRNLGGQSFEDALKSTLTGPFTDHDLPIIISGMVGARSGWIEAPYVGCPTALGTLANGLIKAPSKTLNVYIVPGLSFHDRSNDTIHVMRGEETQILGLGLLDDRARIVLPGTHSKWCDLSQGEVKSFKTYMTGELFDLLKSQSILGQLMHGDVFDPLAFEMGIKRATKDNSLSSLLFSVRTEGLFARLEPQSLSSYLSGILIGSELANALMNNDHSPIHLIGDAQLCRLYDTALTHLGHSKTTIHDAAQVTVQGLWAIATAGAIV